MARTRTQLRQLTTREMRLNIFRTGTANSSGGSTTTLIDDPLKVDLDDSFNGAHLYISDGSPSTRELQISDFEQSTGKLTFRPALGAAPDSLAYEILPLPATTIHQAITDVMAELAGMRMLERRLLLTTVTGSPAYNSDFAFWNSVNQPDGYNVITGTPVIDKTNIWLAQQSMSLASGEVRVSGTTNIQPFVGFSGNTVTFYCWVKTSTADQARIAIGDSGTFVYSSYHPGDGTWRLLSVQRVLDNPSSSLIPTFLSSAATSFSAWYLLGNRDIQEYRLLTATAPQEPDEITISDVDESASGLTVGDVSRLDRRRHHNKPFTTLIHDDAAGNRNQFIVFDEPQPAGHRLYISTRVALTAPTADADNVEVNEQESLVIGKMAARKLLDDMKSVSSPTLRSQITARISSLDRETAMILSDLDTDPHSADLPLSWNA